MRPVHVQPLAMDEAIARFIADHTTPALERTSRLLTLAADEHVLYVLSAVLWLQGQFAGRRQRIGANHVLACTIVANLLPHLVKRFVDQQRPDRRMVHGRRRGIPRSGKANDAFPSGHAMHVGALASAVSWIYPRYRTLTWSVGGLVATTRVVVLAHWASDVVAGLLAGAVIERMLRPFAETGR